MVVVVIGMCHGCRNYVVVWCEWVSLRYSVMVTWWLWSLVCGALLGQHHGCRNYVVVWCEWVSLRYSVMVTWCGALLVQHHDCRNYVA